MQKKIEDIIRRYSISEEAIQELMDCMQGMVSSFPTIDPLHKSIDSQQETQEENTVLIPGGLERKGSANLSSNKRKYKDIGELGVGGMGEVRKVEDIRLSRTMAMKVAKQTVMKSPSSLNRFG